MVAPRSFAAVEEADTDMAAPAVDKRGAELDILVGTVGMLGQLADKALGMLGQLADKALDIVDTVVGRAVPHSSSCYCYETDSVTLREKWLPEQKTQL